jgi:hypothetical protein
MIRTAPSDGSVLFGRLEVVTLGEAEGPASMLFGKTWIREL